MKLNQQFFSILFPPSANIKNRYIHTSGRGGGAGGASPPLSEFFAAPSWRPKICNPQIFSVQPPKFLAVRPKIFTFS